MVNAVNVFWLNAQDGDVNAVVHSAIHISKLLKHFKRLVHQLRGVCRDDFG